MRKFILFCFMVLLLVSAGCASRATVKKILQNDPQLLMEVLHEQRFELLALIQDALNEEQFLARNKELKAAAKNPLVPAMREFLVVEGRVDAKVTIFEYSDFLCPFCVRGHKTMNALLKKYPGKIRVIYKHNPIKKGALGLAALYEAVATKDPAKAIVFKDLLFARQKEIYAAKGKGTIVKDILTSLGLNAEKIRTVATEAKLVKRIQADMEELHSFGMDGTPMFIVGGVPIQGAVPMEEFEAALKLALDNTN